MALPLHRTKLHHGAFYQAARLPKKMSCSTHLSMPFIRLINVKMSTIVDILTIISMINTTSDSFKAKQNNYFQHFSFISS